MQGQRRHLNVLQGRQPTPSLPGRHLQGLLMESLGCMGGCGGCPMKGGCGSPAELQAASKPLQPRESLPRQSPTENRPAYGAENDRGHAEEGLSSRAFSDLLLCAELNMERKRISAGENLKSPKARASEDAKPEAASEPGYAPLRSAPPRWTFEDAPSPRNGAYNPESKTRALELPRFIPESGFDSKGNSRQSGARAQDASPEVRDYAANHSESVPLPCIAAAASINIAAMDRALSGLPEVKSSRKSEPNGFSKPASPSHGKEAPGPPVVLTSPAKKGGEGEARGEPPKSRTVAPSHAPLSTGWQAKPGLLQRPPRPAEETCPVKSPPCHPVAARLERGTQRKAGAGAPQALCKKEPFHPDSGPAPRGDHRTHRGAKARPARSKDRSKDIALLFFVFSILLKRNKRRKRPSIRFS